jgi:hypothetical protein
MLKIEPAMEKITMFDTVFYADGSIDQSPTKMAVENQRTKKTSWKCRDM